MSVAGFAEGGGASVTQPDDALREDGFAFGEGIAHDELNWLLRDLYRRAAASALWTSSARAVETGAPAIVHLAPLGSPGSDAGVAFPFTPASSGEGAILCADAARVYVRSGGSEVKALDAATHGVLWTGSKIGLGSIMALCCGFGYVFAGGADDDDYAIVAFDAETGNVTATLASDGENTAAIACGDGFVVRASLDTVSVYNSATLALVASYSHGGYVYGVAVSGDLVALLGQASSTYTARLFAFDGAALSEIWRVAGSDPTEGGSVGFIVDSVAVYDEAADEIRLYPVARYASAPGALAPYVSPLDRASGSSPVVFSDWGVCYVRNNSARKPMLLNERLEPVSLAAFGGFDGVAFGGNCIHAIGGIGSTRFASTSQVTQCAVQGGLLRGTR